MAKLTALNSGEHADVRIGHDSGIIYARNSHMLPLRVTEVAQATVDFPVMMSRMSNGAISLSALTSFEPHKNLFISGDEWTSSFQPTAMKTYPLFLMKDDKGGAKPVLGIDAESEALSKDEGQALFDKKARLSLHTKQLQAQLMEDSKNMVHTFQFFETLSEFDLIRSVDLAVNYSDGQINRIRGLSMIHEDNLQKLSSERLTELRDRGYLAPIYAMLFSVFQLNALIRKNNQNAESASIKNINLEVSKDNRPA
ncbi:SapC family protein [Hellea balneolensis]|uniref:SapC family protein n=1 Tax=Hellea balneolensis TaxID=287478 RepID=UPI0004163F57|nr:SapC family protein [Hellea balneolensis]